MNLKDKLPGLRDEPGHRIRNTLIGIVYAFLFLALLGTVFGSGEDTATDAPEGETDAAEGESEAQASEGESGDSSDGGDGGAGESDSESNSDGDSGETDSNSGASEGDSGDSDGEASDDSESSQAATDGGEAQTADQAAQTDSQQGLTPADMERVLSNEGLDVYVMDSGDGTIEVDYFSYAGGDQQKLVNEIGAISGAYAGLVGDGYETDEMVINVMTPAGESVGEFRADADDAQAFQDGEISAEEYLRRVLATGEVYEEQ